MKNLALNWEFLDLPNLKNISEISEYIKLQLVKFFPNPNDLIFDYIITGNRENKVALICYSYRWSNLEELEFNPLLLIKKLLKKSGLYTVITETFTCQIVIESLSVKEFNLEKISPRGVVITTSDKLSEIKTKYPQLKVVEVIKYTKSKLKLFSPHKKRIEVVPLTIVALLSLLLLTPLIYRNTELKGKVLNIRKDIDSSKVINNLEVQNESSYIKKRSELLLLQSKIEPDLLYILNNLNIEGVNFTIKNLTYSNRTLKIVAVTKNGYDLVKKLNNSGAFTLKLNNTIPTPEGEVVNISGKVLWL